MDTRKKVKIAIIVFLIVILCAFNVTFAAAPKVDSITVLSGPMPYMMPKVLEDFQKQTGIKVDYSEMALPSMHSKLATIFAAKSPDIDVVWTYSAWTAEFGSAGFLEPISRRISPELKKDLIPGALESVTYKGVMYGLPRFFSIRSLFYNKKLFSEAGLNPEKPPQTWEEFKNACVKLTKEGTGGRPAQWGYLGEYGAPNNCVMSFEIFLYLNQGHMFNNKDQVLFNDKRGVKALSELVELHKLGVVDPASMGIASSTDKVTRWIQGIDGIHFGWNNTVNFSNDPTQSKIVGQLGYGMMPVFEKQSASLGGSEAYAISKFSKKKDAAFKFIEFVASKEVQKGIALRTGWMPVRYSVFDDPEIQEKLPLSKVIAKQAKFPAYRFAAPYAQEVIDALGPEILLAVKGSETPKQALDNAAARAQMIVMKYK
jgi:multiple sugar transport system substrate-binding protein